MNIKSFLGALLLFCSLPAAALAQELFENGSFESATAEGRPVGWFCSEQAWARGPGTWIGIPQVITPHSGNLMVNLAPGGLGTQAIWQVVDFTGYSLATLSFWWRYEGYDYDVEDMGRDQLEVEVLDPGDANSDWDTIWSSPINIDPSDGQVVSPWMFVTFSGDVTELSRLAFRFRLRNTGDGGEPVWQEPDGGPMHGQMTTAFIDDASLMAAATITDFLGNIGITVQALRDSGSLNDGQANSLSVKLNAAINAIDRGNTVAAVGQLKAFHNEVAALEKSVRLSPAQSQSLVSPADYAIGILKQ